MRMPERPLASSGPSGYTPVIRQSYLRTKPCWTMPQTTNIHQNREDSKKKETLRAQHQTDGASRSPIHGPTARMLPQRRYYRRHLQTPLVSRPLYASTCKLASTNNPSPHAFQPTKKTPHRTDTQAPIVGHGRKSFDHDTRSQQQQ
jgi:hypothetical protein